MKTENFGKNQTLRGFQKNPQNINRKGRPRKLVNIINHELQAEGYETVKSEQVKECYMTLLNLPFNKIKKMAEVTPRDDMPILYKLVAKEMIGKRGIEMLDRMLDRAIGKATQPLDHTTKGNISIQITPEDAEL